MKNRLLHNWNFVRVLRLIFGVAVGIQAVAAKEYLLLFVALFFAATALLNVGCCGSNGCATNIRRTKDTKQKREYEEVGT